MRHELTIDPAYAPSWGLQEALREFSQNAADEQDRDPAHAMQVKYTSRGTGVVTIVSRGVVLDKSVLLLGRTTKEDGRSRGKFGEGLDLALLAAVRAGHDLRIENGQETWTPSLEYSAGWGSNVLCVTTRQLPHPRVDFVVEIRGVSPAAWDECLRRTLFLPGAVPAGEKVIAVGEQRVLLNRPGAVYVRGLWVGHVSSLVCGYDLTSLPLDRDRKLVDTWALRHEMALLWTTAMATQGKEGVDMAARLLEGDAADTAGLGWLFTGGKQYSPAATEGGTKLAAHFTTKFGESAVPVSSTSASEKARSVGLTPVVMPANMVSALEGALGQTLAQAVEKAGKVPLRVFTVSELGAMGLAARWQHVRRVAARIGVTCPLSVVETADPDVLGLYRAADGICLSVACLTALAPGLALVTLAHEAAHAAGAGTHDGNHTANAEHLIEKVIDASIEWDLDR